jgi:ABC-type amino acid transport substrate-binding protein
MVLNNEVDLMVADLSTCVLAVMRHPDSSLATLKAPLNMEPIGIAISNEDAQFANLLTNFLATYKAAGILETLRKKWLENDAWISSIP